MNQQNKTLGWKKHSGTCMPNLDAQANREANTTQGLKIHMTQQNKTLGSKQTFGNMYAAFQ